MFIHRSPITLVNTYFLLFRKGSIAGVVNPIFKTRTDLWDVLCDLSDGSVVYNPDNRGPSVNVQMGAQNLYKQVDLEFVEQILALINSHALKGVNPSYSEDAVRSHFQVSCECYWLFML